MGIERGKAVIVPYEHPAAIGRIRTGQIGVSGADYGTGKGGFNRGSWGRRDIYPIVPLPSIYLRVSGREWGITEVLGNTDLIERPREHPRTIAG